MIADKSAKKTPVAMLVLYEPGFRFKFKKYYLAIGTNLVGSLKSADVCLNDGPQRAATILITEDLAIIQPIVNNAVMIMSNMKKKTPAKLKLGMSYVVEMEKDFSIGERKALMQIMSTEDLWRVNNVENKHLFEKINLPPNHLENPSSQNTHKNSQARPVRAGFQSTLPINENQCFQATLPINDNQYFEPTILMDDKEYFQPTLPINENQCFDSTLPIDTIFGGSKPNEFPSSLSANRSSFPPARNESQPVAQENENFSMPDTISQNEMPDTIQEMPATIQQLSSRKDDSEQKMRKTVPQKGKKEVVPRRQFQSLNQKPIKQIQNFDDLFQSNTFSDPQMKMSLQKKDSILSGFEDQEKKQKKNLSHLEEQESGGTEKISSENDEKSKFKKAGVVNCRKSDLNEKQLKKKGFKIVDHPDDPFELLLVGPGELKRSTRLLKALMEGKQIKSFNWITNPKAKITGKLQGFLWESIEKRKGNKGKIFKGNYFLQPQLRDEFEEVMRFGGAEMVQVLEKKKSKTNISIVIDEKHPIGREIFEEKKNYKKWEFYSYRMVIESVLMGEQISKKYAIDEYSF